MKVLITGLTLHNNKGGAALALSLIDKLKKEFDEVLFYLSVPNNGKNLELEKKWADFYGVEDVVGAVGVKELLYIKRERRETFLIFLKEVDLIIDLNALSYMDLPSLTYKQNLIRNLSIYTIRGLSNQLNKPLIRWTQSYGPFSSYFTKLIVKQDLKNQKNIFVRGEGSLSNLQQICKDKNIVSFPDIAITLNGDKSYYTKYLNDKNYVTLSPSSVIYGIDGELHIQQFRELLAYILEKGYEVVFVPHTLMSINPTLYNCDLKVCEKILETVKSENVHLVKKDLDVYNLKGIIAHASLHIGARYHSIIASLSTSVPTVAFSWHEKYMDIMKMYQMEKYIYDGKSDISQLCDYVNELLNNRNKTIKTLKLQQNVLELEVEKNIVLFMESFNEL